MGGKALLQDSPRLYWYESYLKVSENLITYLDPIGLFLKKNMKAAFGEVVGYGSLAY